MLFPGDKAYKNLNIGGMKQSGFLFRIELPAADMCGKYVYKNTRVNLPGYSLQG